MTFIAPVKLLLLVLIKLFSSLAVLNSCVTLVSVEVL
nr:MAG TPA: hypothetical protein [Caudoviricetes sp.]